MNSLDNISSNTFSPKDGIDLNSSTALFNLTKPSNVNNNVKVLEPESTSVISPDSLLSQTATIADAQKIIQNTFAEVFKIKFLQFLNESEFEFGFVTPADNYIVSTIDSYPTFAWNWIVILFLEYFSNPDITSSLLRILAHLPESPQGKTIAIASIIHRNSFVQECAIRCFENWQNPDCISILQTLAIQEEWLKSYINKVISDLTKKK